MTGIAPGFFPIRIESHHLGPLSGGPDHEVGLDAEPLAGALLEQPLDPRSAREPAGEYEIPALEQGPRLLEPERAREIAQIGHRDAPLAGEVHGPQQRDP